MDSGKVAPDRGFTLIELLVVIVILGVLATVVVFAVGGVVDRGEVSALEGDARTLQTAEESHYAIHGEYATETELVGAGLLRDESDLHDITIEPGGTDYTIAPVGDGGGDGGDGGDGTPESETTTTLATPPEETTTTTTPAPPEAIDTTYAGQNGLSYGSGSKKLVVIGNGSGAAGSALWTQITTAQTALNAEATQVIWMPEVDSRADVDAILATGPTYVIVPIQVDLAGGGYAGQYISGLGRSSPGQFWWGQQQGGVTGAINYYLTHF